MREDYEGASLTLPVTERDHIQGPFDAPLTLVEYGDYQCPYCGDAYPIVKAVQHAAGDRLRFVFRNFPLVNAHPNAEHAAEAAEWAAVQKQFWEMHDILYENQNALEDSYLAEYASQLGLDRRALLRDIKESRFEQRIREDFMSGVKSGVNGTPTFFINGFRYDGDYDVKSLLAALEEAEPEPSGAPAASSGRGKRRVSNKAS